MDNTGSARTIVVVCLICLLVAAMGAGFIVNAASIPAHAGALVAGGHPGRDKFAYGGASERKEDERARDNSSSAALNGAVATDSSQPQQIAIIVAGRTLTGPQSFSQQRGGRIFLPVASIARALGDVVKVVATACTVEVRRQTGVIAEFNAQLNQISENGSLILSVSNTADIIFPPHADELMLPVEIVSALLDASIRLDETAHAVSVTRGRAQVDTVRVGAPRAAFELYQVEYDYNLNRSSSSSNQSLGLRADGRIADGRFSLITNSSIGTAKSFGQLRNATFTYERAAGQRFVGGDFGTGTDLLFMSSSVRGVSARVPLKGARVTAFAGQAVSGVTRLQPQFPLFTDTQTPDLIQSNKFRYDTNVFGAYATFSPSATILNLPGKMFFSTGMINFSGPDRSGNLFAGSARYASARAQVQGDVGVGRFRGTQPDGSRAGGIGLAADLSSSYDLSDSLTVQGRYTYIGANFLAPQAGLQEPIKLAAGGVTWRPRQWLAASLTGSFSTRPDALKQRERFTAATFNITPRGSWPTILFSHTQSSTTQVRAGAYTLLNMSKDFAKWRLFLNATRVKTLGPVSLNAQVGANLRLDEHNSLQLSQSAGSHGALSGAVDWNTQSFLGKRAGIGAGFRYNRAGGSSLTTAGRLFATLQLPRQSVLQFTYLQGPSGPQLLLSLRGLLRHTRRAEAATMAPVSEMNSYGSFYGRVYQDINLDGRFDPGLDQPQANAAIRVDGSRYVVSDESGQYRVDNVRTGAHEIRLDLLSVRADLTLLDEARQAAVLAQGRDSIIDFRLVPTGRITGIVWLDLNGNGRMDDGEQPLADVRLVTGSNRDTLTNEDGVFLIGDLPPGEHVILIDEKTLPEKTVSAVGTLSAKVLAGSETGHINFPVTPAPPEIRRFTSKKN